MGQAKLRPNRVAEAIQRRIEKEKEQEEQRQARRPFALQKHQVQAAAILGAAFSMLDTRARRITEMAALQQSNRVRDRPEVKVVILDDERTLDVDR